MGNWRLRAKPVAAEALDIYSDSASPWLDTRHHPPLGVPSGWGCPTEAHLTSVDTHVWRSSFTQFFMVKKGEGVAIGVNFVCFAGKERIYIYI